MKNLDKKEIEILITSIQLSLDKYRKLEHDYDVDIRTIAKNKIDKLSKTWEKLERILN